MTRLMERVSIFTMMAQSMMENGWKIPNMDLELRPGLMVLGMKVTTNKERSMVTESLTGLMVLHTRVISNGIISKEQ